MKNQTLIVAHRGGDLGAVENTIEAFEKSIALSIDMIELDVRKTKDNYLVCYHDPTIDGKSLKELDYREILKISTEKGFKVPLLEDVILACSKKIKLDIELKETGYEEKVLSLITRYLPYSEFVLKSFNYESVTKIKKINPKVTVGLLLGEDQEEFNKFSICRKILELFPEYRILKSRLDFVSPHYNLLQLNFVSRMKLLKKKVYVWTVNEEEVFEKLYRMKIDAVITDKPDKCLQILKRKRMSHLNF
ncbi:MAG: glycerophosphodiester phosphodiesterase [Cyanobacteria bacterium J06643_5]